VKGSALAAVEGKDDEIGKNAIMELMKAVDEHIPQPDRPKDKPFLMPVEDVFFNIRKRNSCYRKS